MSNKLATKHKSSLTLKSPIKKSHFNERKYADNAEKCEKEFKVTIFPFVICFIFFIHWIIVCPLIWALLYRTEFSENWPNYWPYLYWLVAFFIWLLPMLIFLLIWRRLTTDENDRLISGANSLEISDEKNSCLKNSDEFDQPEILELTSISCKKDEDRSEDYKARKERRKQLAPLVIHRNMSGLSGTENSGDVKIETPIEEKTEENIDKDLMDKYLKFVTLERPLSLRSSIVSEKSDPDVPLSPRELFFIDLIRNAEKNEDKNCTDSSTKLARFISQEKSATGIKTRTTEESSYFIADVESPVTHKNEFFIEIQEPEMTLKSVTNEISISQDCSKKINIVNDDCCLLPNEIMIPQFHQGNSITGLATPVIFYQSLPLQLEYGLEPEQLLFVPELNPIEGCMHSGQIVDNIRHLYLGKLPLVVKQCTRCGGKAQVPNMTRTAAIRAWDQRWTRACRCGGTWRIHKISQ